MKYFKAILVVSLIFIFPAVSYLYLRYGFMYRKDALEILSAEVDFTSTQLDYLASFDTSYKSTIKSGVNVFQVVQDEVDEKNLYFLAENFEKRDDIRIFGLYEDNTLPSLQDTIFSNVLHRLYSDSIAAKEFMDNSWLILSKDNKIRKEYNFELESKKTAYEHTVILLPMKKRDKIKLIRDKEI